MFLWANYIFPRWVCLFCWRKYVDRSWEYINCSQTHECVNWGWGRAIPRKGIYKRNCRCSVGWGMHALPLSLYLPQSTQSGNLPSCTKLWCSLQLRGQIHSSYFYSTPICTLCCPQPLFAHCTSPEPGIGKSSEIDTLE
jgi:hypothetical protein